MQIIPAILTDKHSELIKLIKQIEQSKKFSRVQIDFVDKTFGNQTLVVPQTYPPDFKPLLFDAHLMTSKETIGNDVLEARLVGFNRVIAQVESIEDQGKFLLWTEGYKRGLAIDLDTDVSYIDASIYRALDLVLLMAVPAGQGEQRFDERVLDKIKKITGWGVKICVDGGVEQKHLPILEKLGVDEVAVGARRVLEWN